MKDFDKALMRLESVTEIIEEAHRNNINITMTKACKQAGISETYIYRLLDNADDYQLDETLLDRFNYARDCAIDLITQRVREIGQDRYVEVVNEEGVVEQVYDDSPLKIARSKINEGSERWLLKTLMPRTFGERTNVQVTNNTENKHLNVIMQGLTEEQLKALASIRLIGN